MTNVNTCAGEFAGRFRLEVKNSGGEIVRESDWMDNLITDYGLNYILQADNRSLTDQAGGYIAVGTSSTPPLVTDVALGAQIGPRILPTVSSTPVNAGPPLYYTYSIKSFTYAQGAVVGNIAEVGRFTATTGNNAATRALVRDSSGNPTTFTVLATETLTVTYELRFYPNLSDTSGTFNIGATVYNYTQRSRYITGNSGAGVDLPARGHGGPTVAGSLYATQALPAIGVGAAGTRFGSDSFSIATYTNNSFTIQETVIWGPTAGNVPGGIGFCEYGMVSTPVSNNQGFFMTISPVINKTNLQTLSLTFSISYGRRTI